MAQPAPPAAPEQLLVDFTLNGVGQHTVLLVLRRDGDYFLRAADFTTLGLRVPEAAALTDRGEAFFPLAALAPTSLTFDEARQMVVAVLPAGAFTATVIALGRGQRHPPTAAAPSLVLTYDVTASRFGRSSQGGGALEAAAAGGFGTAVTSVLGNWASGLKARVARLESYYLIDDVSRLLRLRLGDGITDGGGFGAASRFGGIQIATEDGLAPELSPLAIPGLSGSLDNAATVAVFVDDTLHYQADLPPGPFSITDLPSVTGAGETRLVIRDLLGREQDIVQPFYLSPRSLAAGRQKFSYQAGALRRQYGTGSFDYGRAFLAGSHRYGVTSWLTLDGHGEAARGGGLFGLGATLVAPRLGEFFASAAQSGGRSGTGRQWTVGLQRAARGVSVGAAYTRRDAAFATLDEDRLSSLSSGRLVERIQGNVGLDFGRFGSLGASFARLRFDDGAAPALLAASYAARLGPDTTLAARGTLSDSRDNGRELGLALVLTTALGNRRSVAASVEHTAGGFTSGASLSDRSDGLYGADLDLLAETGARQRVLGRVDWRTPYADLSADAVTGDGGTGLRLGASGSIAMAGGGVFPLERVYDSFAVVTVPDYPGVTIYRDNQPVGRTDADGRLAVSNLRAYEANQIRLEPRDLPIDARVDRDEVTLVPRARGAVVARFPVARQRSATLLIRLADGRPPPPGAEVSFDAAAQTAFTGYDGEVFVADLSRPLAGRVRFLGQSCRFAAPALGPADGPLPRVGPLTCREE